MTLQRWQLIDKLFHEALEVDAGRRDSFLAQACAGDESLHRDLKSLLAAHDQDGTFFESLRAELAAEVIAERKSPDMVGSTVGRYQFLSSLGAGGMGEVYRALDTRLDREVAVKILPPHLAMKPQALLRFEREAKAVAALSHPNILSIHDFGTENGVSYAVMELLQGETLRSRLAKGRLPWRKAIAIGGEIAEGLAAAHDKGITHRDLKPENIFLTEDGKTKILDFGLARVRPAIVSDQVSLAETAPLVTRPGAVMGTHGYMSPEQVRGEEVDAASDIFSFGCVLSEMITGRKTFVRATAAETMAAILKDHPAELSDQGLSIPAELERVIDRCLEKNPRQRFQSAHDLAFALKEIPSAPRPSSFGYSRRFWLLTGLILLTAMIVVYSVVSRPTSAKVSLAVLPMDNQSGRPDLESQVDTITKELTTILGSITALNVISQDPMAQYKGTGKPAAEIGRELNVSFLVKGSARYLGDSVQMETALLRAETGQILFNGKFEGKTRDLPNLENQIVLALLQAVQAHITNDERARLSRVRQVNPEAYRLYSQGLTHLDSRIPAGINRAVHLFRGALGKDPEFGPAWAAYAKSHIVGDFSWPESSLVALGAAKKALELDNTLAEAHACLASVYMLHEWNWFAADTEYQRAIQLNPSDVTAHHWYAEYLTAMGRHEDALHEIRQAQLHSPLSQIIKRDIGWHYYCARRYDEAIAQLQSILRIAPPDDKKMEFVHWLLGYAYAKKSMFDEAIDEMRIALALNNRIDNRARLAYAYAIAGRKDEAWQIVEELKQAPPELSPDLSFQLATIYGELGEMDEAFRCLDQSYDRHSGKLVYLNVVPMLDSLRDDQRFRDLIVRIGLPR